eukprot:scaffold2952_cov312-Pinguiococcus_pyrenoidosus.AAC.12
MRTRPSRSVPSSGPIAPSKKLLAYLLLELQLLLAQVFEAQADALLRAGLVGDGHHDLGGLHGGVADFLGDALRFRVLERLEASGHHRAELLSAGHALLAEAAEVGRGGVVPLERRVGVHHCSGEAGLASKHPHDADEVCAANLASFRQRLPRRAVLDAHQSQLLLLVDHRTGGHERVRHARRVQLGRHGGKVRHGSVVRQRHRRDHVLEACCDGHISHGGEAANICIEVNPRVLSVQDALHRRHVRAVSLLKLQHIQQPGVARRPRDQALLGGRVVRIQGDDLIPGARRVENIEDELVVPLRIVQKPRNQDGASGQIQRRLAKVVGALRSGRSLIADRDAPCEAIRPPHQRERAGAGGRERQTEQTYGSHRKSARCMDKIPLQDRIPQPPRDSSKAGNPGQAF